MENRAGIFISQPLGYKTFKPKPLPPDPPIFYDSEMIDLLSRADRMLGRPDGVTETLPDPELFVAEKQGAYTYFQVTADMAAKETFDRELKPLTNIRDNYKKVVLTGDRFTIGNYNGIQVVNLSDWLLGR